MNDRALTVALLCAVLAGGAAGGAEPDAAGIEKELTSGDRGRVEKAGRRLVESYRRDGLREVSPVAAAIFAAWEKHTDVRDVETMLRIVPLPRDAELRRRLAGLLDAAVKAGEARKIATLTVAAGSCGEDARQFIPTILWTLQHKDLACRQAGLAALARMGKPAAAQAGGAVAQLAAGDRDCQFLALVTLIRMGVPVARATLETALKAQKLETAMALEAVILDEQAKPLLLSADRRVQFLAWSALRGLVSSAKDRNVAVLRAPPNFQPVIDADPRPRVLAQADWIVANADKVIEQKGDAWEAAIGVRNGTKDLRQQAAEGQQKKPPAN